MFLARTTFGKLDYDKSTKDNVNTMKEFFFLSRALNEHGTVV